MGTQQIGPASRRWEAEGSNLPHGMGDPAQDRGSGRQLRHIFSGSRNSSSKLFLHLMRALICDLASGARAALSARRSESPLSNLENQITRVQNAREMGHPTLADTLNFERPEQAEIKIAARCSEKDAVLAVC